jgi:hypothetical protein
LSRRTNAKYYAAGKSATAATAYNSTAAPQEISKYHQFGRSCNPDHGRHAMTGASAMIKVAGLWRHTSAKGSEYLVGRMAGAKILIYENRDRKGEDEPTHHLFFAEPTPPAASTSPAPHPKRRGLPQRPGSGRDLPSDDIGDLWHEEMP